MATLEEIEKREIEIDSQGNAWRITWSEIYRDGEKISGNKKTDARREQITPDAPPPDNDPEAVAVFDAVFDDSKIDAYFDKIAANEKLDENQRAKIETRRTAAKSAREQRQRQKQNRP